MEKEIQLFCVPYAGGFAQSFAPLIKEMDRNITVIPLEYAGHGERKAESYYESFQAMVQDIASQIRAQRKPDASVAVLGYSMGSVVVYEMLAGDMLGFSPAHIFLASHEAPNQNWQGFGVAIEDEDKMVSFLKQLGGFDRVTDKTMKNRFFRAMYYEPIIADYRLLQSYEMSQFQKIKENVTVFYAEKDIPYEKMKAWKEFAGGEMELVEIGSNHFFLQTHTKMLAELIGDRLQNAFTPKYSVLMSVYHKEKAEYLKESLDSILRQTVMPSQIVVVCDGPLTEALNQVLKKKEQEYQGLFDIVRLKRQMGLGGALNIGMEHCRFEYVARMDSDDISCADRMEQQLNAMQQQSADIVSGTIAEFTEKPTADGRLRRLPETAEEILRFSRRRNPFNHPCVMYKKSAVQKAGGYQPFEGFEDYCLWLRMLRCGAVGYNLKQILLYMRTKGMYKRRGGLRYAGRILRFRGYMLRNRFCTLRDYLFTVAGHVGVSLLPDFVRRMFYNKVLRK